MNCHKTEIEGLLILEPRIFEDARGYFFESYNRDQLAGVGIHDDFVQDNEALSAAWVLRGLHYQVGTMAQSKLVRVVAGKVFDIAVDLRTGSPTYGRTFSIELSADNRKQLYIPRGFAHGYIALEENTILCYKCDNRYSREHEGGIRYDDSTLQIAWPLNGQKPIVSGKDMELPYFGTHRQA